MLANQIREAIATEEGAKIDGPEVVEETTPVQTEQPGETSTEGTPVQTAQP